MEIKLPEPKRKGELSVEEAILRRRSVREFGSGKITLEELSQILWAAQGITGEEWGYKLRSVPSAGALYPMEIYAATGEGVYRYLPEEHSLKQVQKGDVREELYRASLHQDFIRDAPLVIVIAAVFKKTKSKYGERGARYVYAEAGHASQNIYLQCESLGLGTVAVGAFYDEAVQKVLKLPRNHKPIYIMPVGRKL
ncbi:MAG: SagB/ThcOx family dehydrogenase [Euryarchaeota archaeon]|nr:SagB/ThcOx family dehydrogenase [Euryarchaeota archaeon]